MAITFEIKPHDDYLWVEASGFDDDIHDAISYQNAIITAGAEHKTRKILCDERNLRYNISTIDTYKIVKHAAEHVGKIGKMAIVSTREQLKDSQFFQSLSSRRGLVIHVTTNFDDAENWLMRES